MWKHSGIGRYLRNVVPLVVPSLAGEAHIRLLGERQLLDERGLATWGANTAWVETLAPIYSPAEQALPLRGVYPVGGLLWTPHFNVPLLYRGALVVTMHDIAPLTSPEIFGSTLRRMVGQMLVKRAARQARAIFCASRFTAGRGP